jgi:trans-2,3-dihydro-3-hydroxyanthranilate isomerase
VIGDRVESKIVAQACHISISDIELQNHTQCVASCGAPFVLAEVKSRAAPAAAHQNAAVFSACLPRDFTTGVHLYVRISDEAVDIQSRMFAPLHGIPEDPATGSANVALIGLLADLAPERSLTLSEQIGQGFDMGRPSIMSAQAVKRDGNDADTYRRRMRRGDARHFPSSLELSRSSVAAWMAARL